MHAFTANLNPNPNPPITLELLNQKLHQYPPLPPADHLHFQIQAQRRIYPYFQKTHLENAISIFLCVRKKVEHILTFIEHNH